MADKKKVLKGGSKWYRGSRVSKGGGCSDRKWF